MQMFGALRIVRDLCAVPHRNGGMVVVRPEVSQHVRARGKGLRATRVLAMMRCNVLSFPSRFVGGRSCAYVDFLCASSCGW